MNFEKLLGKYLDSIRSGETPRLKMGVATALRGFVDWADRNNYEIIQTKGDNGPALFCPRCGVYVLCDEKTKSPKGG
jgi:hypothetical protein